MFDLTCPRHQVRMSELFIHYFLIARFCHHNAAGRQSDYFKYEPHLKQSDHSVNIAYLTRHFIHCSSLQN